MRTVDLMKDPYYVRVLAVIEEQINRSSLDAKDEGVMYTDSNVKSVLNKVRNKLKGKSPKVEKKNRKEELLAELFFELSAMPDIVEFVNDDDETESVPKKDWMLSFKCIEDSLMLRTEGSGSTAYLEYLEDFFPEE